MSFADALSGGWSVLLHSLHCPVTSVVRRRRGFLGECYRGPRHLGGKALVDAAQNASAGVFHTVFIAVDVGDGLRLLELEASLALVTVRHGPEWCVR